MKHSIIRRSILFIGAFFLGHTLNYVLLMAANRFLTDGFGLFYTAILATTVLMAPGVAALMALSRRYTILFSQGGESLAIADCLALFSRGLKVGLPVALAVALGLALVGPSLGIESFPLMILIPLAALALLAVELERVLFQSMLRFVWSSVLWVVSQASQLILALVPLALGGRVWMVFAGVVLGAAMPAWVSFRKLGRRAAGAVSAPSAQPLELKTDIPFIASFSLFILLCSLDILIAYWRLPKAMLDVYAASAFLPKAIVTATLPVAQIVLPVIISQRADGLSARFSIVKAFGLVTLVGLAAALFLVVALPLLQQTPLAVRKLDMGIVSTLALGAVALGAARLAMVIRLSADQRGLALLQSGPIIAIAAWGLLGDVDAAGLANVYAVVGWGFMIITIILLLRSARLPRSIEGTRG